MARQNDPPEGNEAQTPPAAPATGKIPPLRAPRAGASPPAVRPHLMEPRHAPPGGLSPTPAAALPPPLPSSAIGEVLELAPHDVTTMRPAPLSGLPIPLEQRARLEPHTPHDALERAMRDFVGILQNVFYEWNKAHPNDPACERTRRETEDQLDGVRNSIIAPPPAK